ncbi:MAG: ATP-binding protein [Chloroflexota bacterium]|nr:ATP-binding protein [Chloroflexota bacterium]
MARVRSWLALVDGETGIPAKFHGLTLESFPDQSSPALTTVRSWLDGGLNAPGLFLCGLFGRGKTGLVIAALRSAVTEQGVESGGSVDARSLGCFTTTTAMLESLRPQDKGETTNAASLRRYRSARWLALDDLGAERLTEWGADRLFEVINHRHNALLPMLVTSNLSPNELAQKINRQVGDSSGNRIVERLVESCTVIRFDDAAPNWRLS